MLTVEATLPGFWLMGMLALVTYPLDRVYFGPSQDTSSLVIGI